MRAGALHDALKDTNRGSTAGRGRNLVRSALVVSEIAFACVLLVGAGLLIRSFLRVLDVNLGFRPERAAAMRVDPTVHYTTGAEIVAYFDDVLRRARAVHGVAAAGLTDALPLGRNRSWGAPAKGQVYAKGQFSGCVRARGQRRLPRAPWAFPCVAAAIWIRATGSSPIP